MAQRITEDFVRYYRLLVDRTGNTPYRIRRALEGHPDMADSMWKLYMLWRLLEDHRKTSRRRVLVQTDPSFPRAREDYQNRWESACFTNLMDWEAERKGFEPLSVSTDRIVATSAAEVSHTDEQADDDWDFDPDYHSASDHLRNVAEYIGNKVDDGAFFSRAKGALDWLTTTMGVDIGAMEARWREFPIIALPQQVSDTHGLNDPQSLFAYLDNIRLAYVAGAFLAAIAMCRASTEILIREHYNAKDHKTDLTPLIKRTQGQRKFGWMKALNLVAKVNEANEILHSNRDDIRNVDRQRALIRDWIKVIQALIAEAPR